jgi:hypothetical protein
VCTLCAQIGTYQRTYTIANPGQALGSPVTVITNIVIELGSTGNDAVVLNGALTLEEVTVPRVVYKSNVAITVRTTPTPPKALYDMLFVYMCRRINHVTAACGMH